MLEGVNDNTTEVPKNRHMNSSNSVDMEEVTDIVELSWDMPISQQQQQSVDSWVDRRRMHDIFVRVPLRGCTF